MSKIKTKIDLRKLKLKIITDGYVSSINDFVGVFKLEKEFKKEYKMTIDEWEYLESDCDVINNLIEKYLDCESKIYFCEYLEKEDVIKIFYITR